MPSAAHTKDWRHRHPEAVRRHAREQVRRQISELRPAYLRRQARDRVHPVTIEQLKQRIQIRRAQRLLKPMQAANQIIK